MKQVPYPDTWRERCVVIDDYGVLDLFGAAIEVHTGKVPQGHAPLTMRLACRGGLTFAGCLNLWIEKATQEPECKATPSTELS